MSKRTMRQTLLNRRVVVLTAVISAAIFVLALLGDPSGSPKTSFINPIAYLFFSRDTGHTILVVTLLVVLSWAGSIFIDSYFRAAQRRRQQRWNRHTA